VKLRLEDLTLREMIAIEEELGCALSVALEKSQMRATAVMIWTIRKRADPGFTLDQALDLTVGEMQAEIESPPEVPGGGNGLSPPVSPVSGSLTPSP
jgi:hypothetical protein